MRMKRNHAARKAALSHSLTCVRCGNTPVQVSHIMPLWLGGIDTGDNVQSLCLPCHKEWDNFAVPLLPSDCDFTAANSDFLNHPLGWYAWQSVKAKFPHENEQTGFMIARSYLVSYAYA